MAEKVRVKLTGGMAGPKAAYKPGDVITVSPEEAARHVANGNGTIDQGPVEETELQRLRADLAQARAALAARENEQQQQGDASPAKKK